MATIRDWSNFIAGRVAIVTGGGGGVGRAICIQLARAGAEVWVNDLYGDRAEKVVREIEEEGGERHMVLTGDYTDWVQSWEPSALPAGQKLREPEPLFKKLDPGIVEDELRRLDAA